MPKRALCPTASLEPVGPIGWHHSQGHHRHKQASHLQHPQHGSHQPSPFWLKQHGQQDEGWQQNTLLPWYLSSWHLSNPGNIATISSIHQLLSKILSFSHQLYVPWDTSYLLCFFKITYVINVKSVKIYYYN